VTTIAELVLRRAGDSHRALLTDEQTWTWDEWVAECAARAGFLAGALRPGPPHVGVLLDNVPEYSFWLGAAALAGAVIVGINPTRRGAELHRDITHTDCQLIVTSDIYGPLLDGLNLTVPVLDVSQTTYHPAAPPEKEIRGKTGYLLLFTSGTTGAPKACWCSQGRLASISEVVAQRYALTADDVCYQAMPLFHSNALMTGWGPSLVAGAATALRPRFSASGFLPDVRRHSATYFNYVGKPLSYILATPEQPDDADNPLVRVFGNEAAPPDIERFAQRFGCTVDDGYGSTEGGAAVSRVAGMPPGALGVGTPGTAILDPETGAECAAARFDPHGHLINAEEAVGELVSRTAAAGFEGYYNNDEANAARLRDGIYWTGDLAYRDAEGFVYFAGRGHDWLRVDGENIAAAPVERIISRHPDVFLASVYGVPDPAVGDQCMVTLRLRAGAAFDAAAFGAWVDAQADLGPVWAPRFVRVVDELPLTETGKVVKRRLQAERWNVADVWWRPAKRGAFAPLTANEAAALDRQVAARAVLPSQGEPVQGLGDEPVDL